MDGIRTVELSKRYRGVTAPRDAFVVDSRHDA
jgi:hypothetical protein